MSGRRLRHALEYGAFRATRAAWRALPEWLAVRAAAATGLFAGTVVRVRRADVDRHLAIAFPDRSASWRAGVARRCYAHLAREAATLFRMGGWSRERILASVEFDGLELLERSVREGRGGVLLTGHLGNWEVAGAALAASGIPLDVVGKGMANRRFETDLVETRERLGMHVIDMERAPKEVLRALREGRVVAMLADQNAHRSEMFVPFFGKEAATVRGPSLFAARTGAPVFLGIALREPGWAQRYRVTVRPMAFEPSGDAESDGRALLTAYARGLEEAIRAAPEQYFWQHRRWKTRPPEEPSRGA